MLYTLAIVQLAAAASWSPANWYTGVAGTAYAPQQVACPPDANFLRNGATLSDSEKQWLEGRDLVTTRALTDWLSNSNLSGFDAEEFLSKGKVRIAVAFSGGGYRAMLNGAGQFAAMDARHPGTDAPGHMGGIIQASTYLSGLSGGNWLLSSLVVNNWTTVDHLVSSKNVWKFDRPFYANTGNPLVDSARLAKAIAQSGSKYYESGLDPSITDVWGRLLAYQFFDFPDGAANVDYHFVRDYDAFKAYQMPFPIHVADGREPGTKIINLNSTNFEFNPFELGSWDPSIYAFTDLKYLGTNVRDGTPLSDICINDFDNAGFLTSTSSSLVNQALGGLGKISYLKRVAAKFAVNFLIKKNSDIAIYTPNPFYGMSGVDNSITRSTELDLVDGGEDGQNIPLQPLIQPGRQVDMVFAMDNSANTADENPRGGNWANGAALIATYQRQFSSQANGTIFPYVPDQNTFEHGGLAEQPTFFGCNRDNLTSLFDQTLPESSRFYPPVIVYMANSRHSHDSNLKTVISEVSDTDLYGSLRNGYDLVTQNNGTIDSEWRTCVACAMVLREQQRRGESPTQQCQECLTKYCWDGTTVDASTSNSKSGRRDGKSNISGKP